MTLISIIIKNTEDDIDECFNSLLNQSIGFENIEIFIKPSSEEQYSGYENVKAISSFDELNINSGYVMIADSNMVFKEDSFEYLYSKITENHLEFISCCNECMEASVNDINENMELINYKLLTSPIMIDKKLLLKNDDLNLNLTFVARCLFDAKGIENTTKPLMDCLNKKETPDKKELIDFGKDLEKYHESLHRKNIESTFDILEDVWIKMFCQSTISDSDKLDVLMVLKPLFRQYEKFEIKASGKFEAFINLINRKEYVHAVKLSKLLALRYPESKENIIEIIKNQEIYFVFFDWDMEPGGTGTAVINKANNLAKLGYKITLISADTIKNYKYIREEFYNSGRLSKDVKIINIYEYYSDKNTLSDEVIESEIDTNENYTYEKTEHSDKSVTYTYYDKKTSDKIKEELFIEGALAYRRDIKNSRKEFFTLDGFNYLTRVQENDKGKYYLNDRLTSSTIEFTIFNQIIYYFVSKYCDTFNSKPFVICENTSNGFNINRVNPRETMKLGSMHGSPFTIDEDNHKVINPIIPHFKILDELKALVLLTDSAYEDVLEVIDSNNIVSIPNFISDERLEYEPVEKDLNKVKIFSRLDPVKNLSDAIRAFEIVSKHNNDVILEIYGRVVLVNNNQGELGKLKNLIKELELEDKVIFKGFLEDVNVEMRRTLFTLLVSDHEGLPMSLLESMANSTPVISYDIDYGPRDVITNGVDGIIVKHGDYNDLANHMIDLLDNPQKAIDMGVKAKEKIKDEFSASVVSKKWEDLFVKVYAETQINDYEKLLEERGYDKIVKRNNKLKEQKSKLKKDKEKLKKDNKKLKKRIKSLEDINNEILNSTSWKATKPLRTTMHIFKRG